MNTFAKKLKQQRLLLAIAAVLCAVLFVFYYLPLFGWVMAFQDYKPLLGIKGSQFVGLKHFKVLFEDALFWNSLRNTIAMSLIRLSLGMFTTLTVAIFLNEVRSIRFKKVTQTISYLPHFLSWVVAANIVLTTLSSDGVVNRILLAIGLIDQPIVIMGIPALYWLNVALADAWKETGWNAIIYLAAMTAISKELYEAAEVDGCNRIKKIFHITIPSIMPTISIILIINIGNLLRTGFEQYYLLQNSMVTEVSEVIDLYVLRYGINMSRFSFATAAGIFQSVVSIILLIIANRVSKKANGSGLF